MNYQRQKKSGFMTSFAVMLIAAACFGAYVYFSKNSASAQTEPLLVSDESNSSSPFTAQDLATLAKIESINLDSSLFKNPVFVSLRDWTVQLGIEDAGRFNPFASTGAEPIAPKTKVPAAR